MKIMLVGVFSLVAGISLAERHVCQSPTVAKAGRCEHRDSGQRYFSSADEFIENLASSSSWSGKPYHIRCDKEEQQLAKEWFNAVLADYRSARQKAEL